MRNIVVCKEGNGDFTSIQDAIDSVRVLTLEPVSIYIKAGKYEEIVVIPDNKPDIHLIGEDVEKTIISHHLYAEMVDSKQKKLGTFRTPVVSIHADNIQLENITIENTAGYGKEIGQALALYVSGDRGVYQHVRLLGNQDTLYSSRGRQYFSNCYIEGHVDFIFGSGTVVFQHCEIHSLRDGYITASSAPKESTFGFIFFDCKLTGTAIDHSVYLGRPWRPFAQTTFIRTWMGSHIKREGWDNWSDKENEKTSRYYEGESYGPGSADEHRVNWATNLSDSDIEDITIEKIFESSDNWVPKETRKRLDQPRQALDDQE
ncbi:pectinesterase family protein [Metabacillus halosaccharovorans]|uniref:Pectinesterase family protein n=1 Tax=Metabacillus halosaccharovorans TaxID=930124 RepID=A0ABT3DIU7_9BACI|nr:pectinesterase family protein [Metabacillus halosaccharovorans]MCV9886980.1 pectinesterase family protein [Metabacillus halosaccharovorans]